MRLLPRAAHYNDNNGKKKLCLLWPSILKRSTPSFFTKYKYNIPSEIKAGHYQRSQSISKKKQTGKEFAKWSQLLS